MEGPGQGEQKPGTLKDLRDTGDVDHFVLDLVPQLAEPGADADRGKALGALDFLLRFREHRGVVTERAPKEAEEGAVGDAVASAPMTLSWAHDSKVHPALQRAAIDEWMEQQTRDDAAPGILDDRSTQGGDGSRHPPRHPHGAPRVRMDHRRVIVGQAVEGVGAGSRAALQGAGADDEEDDGEGV